MIKAIQVSILPPIFTRFSLVVAMGLSLTGVITSGGFCDETTNSVLFEDKTWQEIQTSLTRGTRTIIIPVGGTEQSGPYISVGKHNRRVLFLSTAIARKMGNTLVAPVISYVPEGQCSPRTSHMRFAGTTSISGPVFEAYLSDAIQSFQAQGFTRIILLGDHGGYQAHLANVAGRLNKRWSDNQARVLYIDKFYSSAYQRFPLWLKEHGYRVGSRQHADIVDTSLTMACSPGDVRRDALQKAQHFTPKEGIYGASPQQASAEIGREGLQMQIDAALDEIRDKEEAFDKGGEAEITQLQEK